MVFNSNGCTRLEVLPKSVKVTSNVTLKCEDEIQKLTAYSYLIEFKLKKNKNYELSYEGCEESFAYIYNEENVIKDGIQILMPQLCKENNTYKENYHFTSPIGWLNDPNGLCYHGGVYHMYYQFYPHTQSWGNMHWGHAVSNDLINWRHMPVFLTPQQNLLENEELAGGAFSGSAVCDNENIRFFLTRHSALRKDESSMVEFQTTLLSKDGIKPENERIIIENTYPEHLYHFRDPKVFTHNGVNYLILGSAINKKAGILLYKSDNFTDWIYVGPVIQIENEQCETVECPDMFKLNEKFVCIAAHMTEIDKDGRKSPVYYYIGDFNGKALQNYTISIYDFGANFYAVQSFEHDGRRIAIGWINDFYEEHRERKNGVCGSMSIPRELFVKNNKLYQMPINEIYLLLDKLLYEGNDDEIDLELENNRWYAEIILNNPTEFTAIVAKDKEKELSINSRNDICYLISTAIKDGLKLNVPIAKIQKLEIFADGRTFEFFINNGEAAGSKTFYSENKFGFFKFKSKEHVKHVKIYSMKTAGEV